MYWIIRLNKAENADFQSYAAGRGYITMLGNAENFCAPPSTADYKQFEAKLMQSNANAEQY